jgi:MFS family permease
MAIVADLVDREDIMNAVALNSAVMNAGRIFGPAVAGGIIELTGIDAALYLNGGCYFFGTACLLLVRGLTQQQAARDTTMLKELWEGLRYFWLTPVTLMVIGLGFAFGFFAMPYLQVMPAFAKETMGAGAAGAGLLIAATGVGSLLGNVALVSLGDFRYKNWLLIGAAFTFGLSLLLFAWSSWFWLSGAILLVVGMGSSGYISMGTTVLQLKVPPDLQGRVLSLWYVSAGLMFIGTLPVAAAAEALGWSVALSIGAVLFLITAAWLGLWRPTLRHLRL